MQRRIFHACHALEYYLNNAWSFPNERFKSLLEEILPTDADTFGSNIWIVDEREYFYTCMLGARKYLLNEPEHTMPAAKKHIAKYINAFALSSCWGPTNCALNFLCLQNVLAERDASLWTLGPRRLHGAQLCGSFQLVDQHSFGFVK
jgi:Male sterility protein